MVGCPGPEYHCNFNLYKWSPQLRSCVHLWVSPSGNTARQLFINVPWSCVEGESCLEYPRPINGAKHCNIDSVIKREYGNRKENHVFRLCFDRSFYISKDRCNDNILWTIKCHVDSLKKLARGGKTECKMNLENGMKMVKMCILFLNQQLWISLNF